MAPFKELRSIVRRLKEYLRSRHPTIFRALRSTRDLIASKLGFHSLDYQFRQIYLQNRWNADETRSGTGSTMTQTQSIRVLLPVLLKEFNIKSLLDLPCGDCNWISVIDLGVDSYIGADIVSELVAANTLAHGRKGFRFQRLDLLKDKLPTVDLILCRDCLVHLSFGDIRRAIENVRQSGSKYILTTTFTRREENAEIMSGHWRPVNLCKPPFNFPPPLQLIDEKCTEGGGTYQDKSLGLWAVSSLPPVDPTMTP